MTPLSDYLCHMIHALVKKMVKMEDGNILIVSGIESLYVELAHVLYLPKYCGSLISIQMLARITHFYGTNVFI